MLDRDPDADQPPDPSMASRARPRSHKPKNAPKKQPQRGLGVAQLEKLRLEEQNKQQEAVCLASLQHHHHHYHGPLHQQELHTPHFLHQHHPFQHHHNSSLFVYPQIKAMEPSAEKPSYPLSVGKPNVLQNSFLPLTFMHSRLQQNTFLQQKSANEDDAPLSPVAQVLDLCSPRHRRPSTAESHLHPVLLRTSPTSQGGNPWLSHLYDIDSAKEKSSTITFISSASCSDSDAKMQSLEQGTTESTNAGISDLHGGHGNLHISMGKLYMQGDQGAMSPITELSLNGQPPGAFSAQNASRTWSEALQATAMSGQSQTRELSSFQTMAIYPAWSTLDKVFNRKRSWACTQELARHTESFRGVDLNVSVDEMEWDLSELNPYGLTPFTISEGLKLSTSLSPPAMENRRNGLTDEEACSGYGSMKIKANKPLSDIWVDGDDAFLSLKQNRSLEHHHEKWADTETSGEFLTLGLSPSSSAMASRSKTEGCSSHTPETDESLDLELRLSV